MESKAVEAGSGNRKSLIVIVFLLMAAIVAIGIYAYVRHTRFYVSTDDAYVTGDVHTVASKVPGTIKTILVKDNQLVRRGDLLLEIDSVDYDIRVQDASALLDTERSRLDELKTRIDLAERQLVEVGFRIDTAQANLKLQVANQAQAQLDLTRAERLFRKEIIPEERLDKARTAYTVAQAQTEAAREQLRQAQAARMTQQVAVEQARVAYQSQQFLIEQRKTGLKAEQLKQGYTRIFAPADGYVTKRSVEIGNQVQAGQPLLAVVSLTDVWIVANYKETQLGRVRPGQKVSIKVDTYPGKTFSGRVESIMAGTGSVFSLFPPENATGNYVKVVQRIPVKIVLDRGTDPEHVLRVGMSVIPTIAVRGK